MTPYLLTLAMSVHASFAGLALGLQNEMTGFIGMFIAIIAHKWAESMTIGISFAKALSDVGYQQTYIIL